MTGAKSSALRPSVEPTSPSSVLFRALYCSGIFTVQFLSLLKCFLPYQVSQSTFAPVTVGGQAFSSVPACRQPGDVQSTWGPLGWGLQTSMPGEGQWLPESGFCPDAPVLNLTGFISRVFFFCLSSFLLFKVLPTQKLICFPMLLDRFNSAHTILDNILTF